MLMKSARKESADTSVQPAAVGSRGVNKCLAYLSDFAYLHFYTPRISSKHLVHGTAFLSGLSNRSERLVNNECNR